MTATLSPKDPAPNNSFDQDVSVVKLVCQTFPISEGRPVILCRNQDNTLRVLFPVTNSLLRILDGKTEVFIRAEFVGPVLVFGEKVAGWDSASWELADE